MQQGSEFASFKGLTVQVSQSLQMPTVKTKQNKKNLLQKLGICLFLASYWQLLKNEINLKLPSLASLT